MEDRKRSDGYGQVDNNANVMYIMILLKIDY